MVETQRENAHRGPYEGHTQVRLGHERELTKLTKDYQLET